MASFKEKVRKITQSQCQVAAVLLLFVLAMALLWFNATNSNQAVSATAAKVRFEGEYSIDGGPWLPITEGVHISSTKGDVTLRGNLYMYSPGGEYIGPYRGQIPIAFYTDHISLTFYEGDGPAYTADRENPMFGVFACGSDWTAHNFYSQSSETIRIVVHNPHRFGNENAIDEMLKKVAIWGNIDFERSQMDLGKDQRNIGMAFAIVAFVLLGSALFSALLHLPNNRIIWLLGVTIMAAGLYIIYSAPGVSFWSEYILANTTMLGASMMFYMLLVSAISTYFLREHKKIGSLVTVSMGLVMAACLVLPMVAEVAFYDTWLPWTLAQIAVSLVLVFCLARECIAAGPRKSWARLVMIPLHIGFAVDAVATALGTWQGGLASSYVFVILFITALLVVLRIIPQNINAAARARELELQHSRLTAEKSKVEAQLKESRISIMLSQIQPHFIYNTLGTIERMCLKDPQKAFDLVRNFSLYLRGNFSELDSVTPIRFADELKHVEYYVNIEKVRFPDMTIQYQVECEDFVIPALTVQPLVENAIKHGLMRLESGGTVVIRAWENETHFCVSVRDDGVGFDTGVTYEDKKHVGLRNVRGRLKAMVNGDLILESRPNAGTTATILIPKEVTA